MKLVKQIRELTGAPMSDCKNAITNSVNEPDVISAACTWLRKVGKAQQAKKTGRPTSQGLVGMYVNQEAKQAILVELNTETDFVAQNEKFQVLLGDIVLAVAKQPTNNIDAVLQLQGQIQPIKIADQLADAVNSLRENIQLTRITVLKADTFVGSYMHQALTHERVPSNVLMGKIGCLVAVKAKGSSPDISIVSSFANTVAMHCAAAVPKYLSPETVPQEAVEAEKKILHEQVVLSGKNVDRADTIVAGRIKKFYEENCLNMQTLVVTENQESVSNAAAEADCELTGFLRFQVGEALSS
jgi:elongation factor Ts